MSSLRVRYESHREVETDSEKDLAGNIQKVLLLLAKPDGLTKGQRLANLNTLTRLMEEGFQSGVNLGVSKRDVFLCLRVAVVHEAKVIRTAGLRALRRLTKTSKDVQTLLDLHIPLFLTRCIDINFDNLSERLQALRLTRCIALVEPSLFPVGLGRSLVTLATEGFRDKDRMTRATLALLSELTILQTGVIIECGGVRALLRAILDCSVPRMMEAMLGSLLYLANQPQRWPSARVDLAALVAPFTDIHYRHVADLGDKEVVGEDQELRVNCASQAILSILRSWPGLLQFCSPERASDPESSALSALIRILYPPHLQTRKAALDLLYELLQLPLPDWTDEWSVALEAARPNRYLEHWKLTEGFISAESKALLPSLGVHRTNLVLNHSALVVYCLIQNGLPDALVHVIVTSDMFIAVRATILLGELLHLSYQWLPPICHGNTGCLPALVAAATSAKVPKHLKEPSSPVSPKAAQAVGALARLHVLKKEEKRFASLGLAQLLHMAKQSQESLSKVNKKTDEDTVTSAIKDSNVLTHKDPLAWDWDLITSIFHFPSDSLCKLDDSNHKIFVRKVVHFFKPSSNLYCRLELNNGRTKVVTIAASNLMDFLIQAEEAESLRFLSEFLEDLGSTLKALCCSSSAHDCLLSPSRVSSSACQAYFLLLGRLSYSSKGTTALEKAGILQDLVDLVSTTHHDCYLKLTVSFMDCSIDGYGRAILKRVLAGGVETGRLYATQHLRTLIRLSPSQKELYCWLLPLLIKQLGDNSRNVAQAAYEILDEATDDAVGLESMVHLKPVLPSNEHTMLIAIKMLATPEGFRYLNETGFVKQELAHWKDKFNQRYVLLIESLLAESLSQHQKTDNGRYGRMSGVKHSVKAVYVPHHLYGQLVQHKEGLDALRTDLHINDLFEIIQDPLALTDDSVRLKAALWAVGHLGVSFYGLSLLDSADIIRSIVEITAGSSVMSIRGTAFYCLNLIASTVQGVNLLAQHGWYGVKRNHVEQWNVISEAEWTGESSFGPVEVPKEKKISVVTSPKRHRTISQGSAHSVTFQEPLGNGRRPSQGQYQDSDRLTECSSTSYSLEGSSVHFSDEDEKDQSSLSTANTKDQRAATLPGANRPRPEGAVHSRSFSDSQYPEICEAVPTPQFTRRPSFGEKGIWGKLRSSLRRTRRWTLGGVRKSATPSPVNLTQFGPDVEVDWLEGNSFEDHDASNVLPNETDGDGSAGMEEMKEANETLDEVPKLRRFSFVNERHDVRDSRVKTTLHYLSSIPYKAPPITSRTVGACYVGLCLPLNLGAIVPSTEVRAERNGKAELINDNLEIQEIVEDHDTKLCIACSSSKSSKVFSVGWNEEKKLVRKELLRLVTNLASSIGLNANEQGLLRLKQRLPWAFQDPCFYWDVCELLAANHYRLRARRFLQELFIDVTFPHVCEEVRITLETAYGVQPLVIEEES